MSRETRILEEITKARPSKSGSLNQYMVNQIRKVLSPRRSLNQPRPGSQADHQALCMELSGVLESGAQDLLRVMRRLEAIGFGGTPR